MKREVYYCDNTSLHKNMETIQILTQEENPKCPYCGGVMTWGHWWREAEPVIMTKSKAVFKRRWK